MMSFRQLKHNAKLLLNERDCLHEETLDLRRPYVQKERLGRRMQKFWK